MPNYREIKIDNFSSLQVITVTDSLSNIIGYVTQNNTSVFTYNSGLWTVNNFGHADSLTFGQQLNTIAPISTQRAVNHIYVSPIYSTNGVAATTIIYNIKIPATLVNGFVVVYTICEGNLTQPNTVTINNGTTRYMKANGLADTVATSAPLVNAISASADARYSMQMYGTTFTSISPLSSFGIITVTYPTARLAMSFACICENVN